MNFRKRCLLIGRMIGLFFVFPISLAQAQICPVMTGALIDACTTAMPVPDTGGGTEGSNEILAFRTGNIGVSVGLLVDALNYYSTTQPIPPEIPGAGQNFTDSYGGNAPYVAALNNIANCGSPLFIDSFTAGTIPAETNFWIMQGITMMHPGPGYPFDFSFLCNNGPIYLLFSTDNTWGNTGNFANGSAANPDLARYFLTDFSTVDASCSQVVYDYFPDQLTDDAMNDPNGASVEFPEAGGSANNYFNDGCTPRTLFEPPPTAGEDAICQTDGSPNHAMEFQTTFCADGEACTQDLCTVDLQALPFSPGLCSNLPITICDSVADGCCPADCEGPVTGDTCFNPDGSPIPGCDEDCSAMGPLPICGDGMAQVENGEECDADDVSNCASGICSSNCSCQALNNVFLEGSGILSCNFQADKLIFHSASNQGILILGLVLTMSVIRLRRRLNI